MSAAQMLPTSAEDQEAHDFRMVVPLLSISKSTRALMGLKLAEVGFFSGQDELLIALDENKPSHVTQLAATLCVRPSTVSKMIDYLAKKDLVERLSVTKDARLRTVRIKPSGLDARSRLLKMREKLENELASALPGDAITTIEALDAVAEGLKLKLKRLR